MKVISKIVLTIETDTETGETSLIKREVLNDDVKPKTPKILGGDEPQLQLNANNFAINQAACDLLNVTSGDKLYIGYQKFGNEYLPVIGSSEAFNVDKGNKLTKSLTVSYRGAAHDQLSSYGDLFTFAEEVVKGIYRLKGNKVFEETVEIDDSFDLSDLEDIDLDLDESTDISTIDLTF